MVIAVTGKCSREQQCVCVCVSTHLNIDDGDGGLGLIEVASHPVHRLGDVIQHQIQIHLIFLVKRNKSKEDCVITGGK